MIDKFGCVSNPVFSGMQCRKSRDGVREKSYELMYQIDKTSYELMRL